MFYSPGIDPNSELTEEDVRAQVSDRDLRRIFEMSKDRNIYQNLATSMFPTIHGTNTFLIRRILKIVYFDNQMFETFKVCNLVI